MSFTDLRKKYHLNQWILGKDQVSIGSKVAFWDEYLDKEIFATIIGFPPATYNELLIVQRENASFTEIINFYEIVVYVIDTNAPQKPSILCTCGAKHTSRPNFHTDWCDLKDNK